MLFGNIKPIEIGPQCDKTCLQGFRLSEIQASLLSYRHYVENGNLACSKLRYDTFQKANNKGADQSARMRRLVCACVVCKPRKTGFLASRPSYNINVTLSVKLSTVLYFIALNWIRLANSAKRIE